MIGNIATAPEIVEEVKADALIEFEQLSKIYRSSFKTRKVCDYLKERVKQLRPEVEVYEDYYRSNLFDDSNNPNLSSGNIWFDLPANDPALEKNEPIILQAHMDMVCACVDEETHKRMQEVGVELEYHQNGTLTSRGNKTSLGADNGIGVAIMLAILKSDSFKHGLIRFIMTTDEEKGMTGASYLGLTKTGEKGGPVQGFKYLVNNDNAFDGEILVSTAGRVISTYMIPVDTEAQPLPSGLNIFTLEVSGLLGGHSGDWIAKHASAVSIAAAIMKDVNKTEDFRLIEFTSPDSTNQNVIHTRAVVTFATSLPLDEIQAFANAQVEKARAQYPEETGIRLSVKPAKLPENVEIRPYSHEIASKIVTLMNKIKVGVMSWKDKSIEWVETSGNMGPIWLTIEKTEKDGKAIWSRPTFELQSGFRSCNNEQVNQLAEESKQLALEVLGNNDLDYYRLKNIFYGWPGNNDSGFVDVAKRAYESRDVKWTTRNLHGGLEVSWFKYFNPDLNMLSIGAEIHNMHSTQETLYTGTLDGVIAVTLDCISYMRWINKNNNK